MCTLILGTLHTSMAERNELKIETSSQPSSHPFGRPFRRVPSKLESFISLAIIIALVFVGAAVLLKQSRFDPTWIISTGKATIMKPASGNSGASFELKRFAPPTVSPLGPEEIFGPENLSDKIDGRAELYLAVGFVRLQAQRFGMGRDLKSWFEVFDYDMGTALNAFSVYSVQRRSGANPVKIARFSYDTSNGFYMAHGVHYIEMVASEPTPDLIQAMTAIGKNLAGSLPASQATIPELDLFPKENLQPGSYAFTVSDAFGFSGLDNVMTARYVANGHEFLAFLSNRKSQALAERMVRDYVDFLIQSGGTMIEVKDGLPGVKAVDILGFFELVFTLGPYIAGVHEVKNLKEAEVLAQTLRANILMTNDGSMVVKKGKR